MPVSPDTPYEIPDVYEELSPLGNRLIQLGSLAGQLALIERTQVDHITGRAENVAEHAHMLSRLAPMVAMSYYPNLDPGIVSLLATVHDDVEIYVGDTPTHELSDEILRDKADREQHGIDQLLKDFSHVPEYLELVKEYEAQESPESRFVRVLDKLMPFIVHFNQGGRTLITGWNKEELAHYSAVKHKYLLDEYPDFAELLELRLNLVKLADRLFYS